MDITIKASDGRSFNGTNFEALVAEVNAHESDLKLKKEKEEIERKKAEETKKKVEQYRAAKLNEINDILHKANDMIVNYEKETGRKVVYAYNHATKNFMVRDTVNTLDFAWDNIAGEMFKAVGKYL